jgi:uncharacterized protein related to proFAR isomerase
MIERPGPNGPEPLLTGSGMPPEPFDVIDRIAERFRVVYVVDLDGVEIGEPQLEYLQEFARDLSLWVDAGTRTADQAIDILVAGASRVVLSSGSLDGREELERAWALSSQIAFEIELVDGRLSLAPGWDVDAVVPLAKAVRSIGPDRLIVSPREADPDWEVIRSVAPILPTWVDGSYTPDQASRLDASGAAGAIVHLPEKEMLPHPSAEAPPADGSPDDRDAR